MHPCTGVKTARVMEVIKRNGGREPVSFDKILKRITLLSTETKRGCLNVDPVLVAQKTIAAIKDGITTSQLDNEAAEAAAFLSQAHPDYGFLAGRILKSNLEKQLPHATFAECMRAARDYVHSKTQAHSPLVTDEIVSLAEAHSEGIEAALAATHMDVGFFGMRTLMNGYLLKTDDGYIESPERMYMRVALGIHGEIGRALETYQLLVTQALSHATPTLFHAGTPQPQMSSCFLLQLKEDSIDGIYDTLKSCATLSKYAGGIGLSIHNLRAAGSHIRGSNGTSSGIVPMLRVFDATARYVDQGGGKRKGSFAIYLEPWHADIENFLELKLNMGKEEMRARDLYYAMWVPDLFMRRVADGGQWSLFCPNECPGLSEAVGDDFQRLYERYEAEGKARRTVQAADLFYRILEVQMETGTPYMLSKEACNKCSNQQHLGTIKSSNLCSEIVQYTSPEEIAVCNLAAVILPAFVGAERRFDYSALARVTAVAVRNLNAIIDRNFYPIDAIRASNERHRPVGLGVIGLADVFARMHLPFDSAEAADVNRMIFETMHYAALRASCDMAREAGKPYETYEGSPVSKGLLQVDLMVKAGYLKPEDKGRFETPRHDWTRLRSDIAKHGIRNSLLLAIMPTASTAQIVGCNESIEPFTDNIYVRRVLAGEFVVVNQHLVRDLTTLGLWNDDVRRKIKEARGSVQNIDAIPAHIRALYKTAWEIPHRVVMDMAADRSPYICQSQSLNAHIYEPTLAKLTSMFFYAWGKGLKTWMYYLRRGTKVVAASYSNDAAAACRRDDPHCKSCSV